MTEVMTQELAGLLDLGEVVLVVEGAIRQLTELQRRVAAGEETAAAAGRREADLMARLAVEQVEHSQLTARVAMLEASQSWAQPPWADAGNPAKGNGHG